MTIARGSMIVRSQEGGFPWEQAIAAVGTILATAVIALAKNLKITKKDPNGQGQGDSPNPNQSPLPTTQKAVESNISRVEDIMNAAQDMIAIQRREIERLTRGQATLTDDNTRLWTTVNETRRQLDTNDQVCRQRLAEKDRQILEMTRKVVHLERTLRENGIRVVWPDDRDILGGAK